MPARKRRPGRPSIRTRAIEERICERIALGESLSSVCRDSAMPAKSTVFRWLANDAVRARQFAIINRAILAEGLMPSAKSG